MSSRCGVGPRPDGADAVCRLCYYYYYYYYYYDDDDKVPSQSQVR
jgi:hypothetical protein